MSKLTRDGVTTVIRDVLTGAQENKRNFRETVELQVGLKNYDPQRDKRFAGSIKYVASLVPFVLRVACLCACFRCAISVSFPCMGPLLPAAICVRMVLPVCLLCGALRSLLAASACTAFRDFLARQVLVCASALAARPIRLLLMCI